MNITLETLPKATPQQVFDHVALHLLTQNEKSVIPNAQTGDDVCVYRGPGRLKCAAGCLIADNEYVPDIEGAAWRGLVTRRFVPIHHSLLIRELQLVHDDYNPSLWPDNLQKVAEEFGLNTDLLKELA